MSLAQDEIGHCAQHPDSKEDHKADEELFAALHRPSVDPVVAPPQRKRRTTDPEVELRGPKGFRFAKDDALGNCARDCNEKAEKDGKSKIVEWHAVYCQLTSD